MLGLSIIRMFFLPKSVKIKNTPDGLPFVGMTDARSSTKKIKDL